MSDLSQPNPESAQRTEQEKHYWADKLANIQKEAHHLEQALLQQEEKLKEAEADLLAIGKAVDECYSLTSEMLDSINDAMRETRGMLDTDIRQKAIAALTALSKHAETAGAKISAIRKCIEEKGLGQHIIGTIRQEQN